jgi:Zn-finger nucleic acid-binding protein
MKLACPKCGTTMGHKVIGKVLVDHCPSCAGMWFDEGELQQGIAGGATSELKRLSAEQAVDAAVDRQQADCPRCSEALQRIPTPGRPDVHVDACHVCGGVWYDGGEVADLLADGVGERLGRFVRGLFGRKDE